ncbi:hypothetical protein VaNZ11_014604 [Volvox africanus]|uniref:Uncharacterized protein n=1 Tax=Volvox africanus TaxID=51714 RepID=A0ABQ5SIU0_9CHLO|nr:hypothetical protein VaNZ11_014604 [Volvox africanus]
MSAEWKQPCWNVIAEPGGPITCVLTCCFPCITYGINVSKLQDAKDQVMCAGDFTSACCLYCCIAGVGCPCIVHIPTRKYIRNKYNVKEPEHGMLEDALMTWCCSCCAIIQDYNEIAASEGASEGTIFSDLTSAKDAATNDIKKTAKTAAKVVEHLDKKDESDDKKDDADNNDDNNDEQDNTHDNDNNNNGKTNDDKAEENAVRLGENK